MKKSRPVDLLPISPAPGPRSGHAVESMDDGILVMDPSDSHIIHTNHSPLLTWTMMVGQMTAPRWRLI